LIDLVYTTPQSLNRLKLTTAYLYILLQGGLVSKGN